MFKMRYPIEDLYKERCVFLAWIKIWINENIHTVEIPFLIFGGPRYIFFCTDFQLTWVDRSIKMYISRSVEKTHIYERPFKYYLVLLRSEEGTNHIDGFSRFFVFSINTKGNEGNHIWKLTLGLSQSSTLVLLLSSNLHDTRV